MKSAPMTNNIPEPTKAELEILQVLWEFGPSTVRFINTLYKGSAAQLMMQLLGNGKTSKDELDEIKKMLDQLADKK